MIEVVVHTELLGTEVGLWCPTCYLPSVLAAYLVITIGQSEPRLMTYTRCTDCGGTTQGG